MGYKPTILIVDDIALVRLQFKALLSGDFHVLDAGTPKEAFSCLEKNSVDLVLLDLMMPDVTGFELFNGIKANYPDTDIIIATVSDDPQMVLKSLKNGAKDYIFKDDLEGNPDILKKTVWEVLTKKQKSQWLDSFVAMQSSATIFIPKNERYTHAYALAFNAVNGDLSLVILGETGVGKSTLVAYIHQTLMPKMPLITVNCSAICQSLAEAELFGSELGAFTGSTETKKGKVELAHGGILFLDEIGNLSQDIQEKLLCALETKRITRVGGNKELQLDFTLITATNKDLEKEVQSGHFRSDLYYRIKQFSVTLPPLRSDSELICQFSKYYLSIFNQKYKTDYKFPLPILDQMIKNPWPGNLRELKNEIQILVWQYSQGLVHRPAWTTPTPTSQERDLPSHLGAIEIHEITTALEKHRYNLAATARELNIHRSTLQGKLRKHAIYPQKTGHQ